MVCVCVCVSVSGFLPKQTGHVKVVGGRARVLHTRVVVLSVWVFKYTCTRLCKCVCVCVCARTHVCEGLGYRRVGCDPFILFLNVLPSIFQTCFVTRPFCSLGDLQVGLCLRFCRAPFFSLLLLFAADMLPLRRGELNGGVAVEGAGGVGRGRAGRMGEWMVQWVGGPSPMNT